jgi:hypothetical protein
MFRNYAKLATKCLKTSLDRKPTDKRPHVRFNIISRPFFAIDPLNKNHDTHEGLLDSVMLFIDDVFSNKKICEVHLVA